MIKELIFDNFDDFLSFCTKLDASKIDFEVHEIKNWSPRVSEWCVVKYKVVWYSND